MENKTESTKVRFDYSLLEQKMIENRYNITTLSRDLGIDRITLGYKLNNVTYFTQNQICKICDLLGIDYREIPNYFFRESV